MSHCASNFQKFSLNLVVNMVFFERGVGLGWKVGYGCAEYKSGSGVHKKLVDFTREGSLN